MRFSILFAALLSGCASTQPAVRECERYLPKDDYDVLEVVQLKNGAIWNLLNARSNSEKPIVLGDSQVHWPRLETWGTQPRITLVMLERKPDKLIFCEVSVCTPSITWLKRVPAHVFDKWEVEKTNENERLCVVR